MDREVRWAHRAFKSTKTKQRRFCFSSKVVECFFSSKVLGCFFSLRFCFFFPFRDFFEGFWRVFRVVFLLGGFNRDFVCLFEGF